MSLPSAEELSRWTVGHVNNWLTESSLTVFRDVFLTDGIDGSKLMRMQPRDIDAKYSSVPLKKRQILKDHLSKIESPRTPPSWNTAAPQLPPRPVARGPAPLPQQPGDDDLSDDDWESDDFDDDIDEEYLEPTTTPAHIKQAQGAGRDLNGHHRTQPPDPEEPQSVYEIPAEELTETRQPESKGLQRRPTLIDRLKNELEIRKRESQVQQDTPPPRPPRLVKSMADGQSCINAKTTEQSVIPSPQVGRHRPPPQPEPPAQELLPPEAEYEIVNDLPTPPESEDAEYLCPETTAAEANSYLDFSDTCKKSLEKKEPKTTMPGSGGEAPLPPRPVKKVSADKPPQQRGWLFKNEQETPKGEDLSTYKWFHGKISRDHAQRIFQREQKDGMFLIRKSERDPQQPYTLVIWHCNRIWNIPIRKVNDDKFAAGKYKQGETHFSSLPDLVEHFKVVSLNLKSDDQVQGSHNLTTPAPKQ